MLVWITAIIEKMRIRGGVLHLFCLFPVIFAIQPTGIQFVGSPDRPRHALCDMGCKCPLKGQILSLLDCSSRGISRLPSPLSFDPPLTTVNLQSNRISHISMGTFSRADAVEELDLSSNNIARIDNFTFTPFRSLASLRISHNHLEEIGAGMLEGLSNLRVLEAGHNALQRLAKGDFRSTPNLLELRLQFNPLFNLKEDLFEYIPKLQRLDLQDTGLVNLPSGIFVPTQNLQWLSLSSNAFENVPEGALSGAPVLEFLDMSGNDFTRLVRGDFRGLSKISLLYLNNLPRLTRIEKDAFVGLERLRTFSCSYNPNLVYIDEEAFGSKNASRERTAPHEQLYLRQNGLTTLKSPLMMSSWSHLSFVDLADNPWKCDCSLLWMSHLKKETQMNIVCESPLHLKGRPFSTVALSDLKCQDQWTLTVFVLTMSLMGVFGLIVLAASAIVCSRTPVGLYIRAKKQFSYAKVVPKTETVDLEWDPSADI